MLLTSSLRQSALAALVVAVFTGAAQAQEGSLTAAPPEKRSKPLRHYGVMVGAGMPDGASASVVYRPYSWLRTEVGGSYNMISKGVRGGLTLIPFGTGPSASLEAGHYFDGNANGIARNIVGGGFRDNAILQRIGYDFVNAHVGLDFGMRRMTFFIHGGMSYVHANVHNVNNQLASGDGSNGMPTSGTTTVTLNQDPTVRIFTPSVKLGLVFYIW